MHGVRLLVLAVAAALLPASVTAQVAADSSTPPPPAFSVVELRRFAFVGLLGAAAYAGDAAVRDGVQASGPQGNAVLDGLAEFGNAWGQPGVVGLGLAMWGGGLLAKRPIVASSGLRAIEAITVSGAVTKLLKGSFGRARPYVAPNDRTDWQLFRGFGHSNGEYEAMPSGHATAAFAFAAAVTGEVAHRAPAHARWVGIATYSAAAVTAYARVHDDRHWLSDVTVGAGVGTVTGLAIVRWHATRPNNVIDRWLLAPILAPSPSGGWTLGLRVSPR
ncbi:MAG: phosphatase PAP2 family protein [Gemmatimonadaceae bacterium]|nr:phosphatase PAP2 family protein [Gemmatimonadaceae bacterium]